MAWLVGAEPRVGCKRSRKDDREQRERDEQAIHGFSLRLARAAVNARRNSVALCPCG
ncbi:MAG: hypothetical protein KC502_04375 [Myxococcales bacterium]|nr:hypothetical protein [Myxococcales bacterium]